MTAPTQYGLAFRAALPGETYHAMQKRLKRAAWKRAGRCTECGSGTKPADRVKCYPCAERSAERKRHCRIRAAHSARALMETAASG